MKLYDSLKSFTTIKSTRDIRKTIIKATNYALLLFLFCSCLKHEIKENNIDDSLKEETETVNEIDGPDVVYKISIENDGDVMYNHNQNVGYSYGPSIIKNENDSYDAWFSSPGNSGSQWDWISYRHSDDGVYWTDPKIVLKPTSGSKDQCSVCDPGVIFFNDYYYLAYSSTDFYEGKGSNNSAFVARSKNPDGPFEKWNGDGWGGNPEPFIAYTDDNRGWGIGEVSFVIKNDDLYIYYTYYDIFSGYCELMKADLTDNWPSTVKYRGKVCSRTTHDSIDVVYSEESETFFAVSIDCRMTSAAKLILLESKDGKEFTDEDYQKNGIQEFAHNVGIAKTKEGHIDSDDDILIGYAFGENWGKWSTIMQRISIKQILF